jgi:Putative beta-barrel porin-2, OmpL-like. bbp2
LKILAAAFAAACVASATPAFAQSATPAPKASAAPAATSPSPSPSPSPTPRAWVTTGFADASYSVAGGSNGFQFANGANSRVFDTVNKQPMLNSLNLQLIHNGTIGGKIELTAGSDALVLASYPTLADESNASIDVTNAYLSGTAGPLTLIVGKFSTLAGAEVIESPSNLDFSRSILFGYAIPFTHTGARLTWTVSPQFTLIGGVNNGWDNTKGNGTGNHTYEGGAAYTAGPLSLSAQGYSGTELTGAWGGPTGHRTVFDTVATYKFGPIVTGTLNYDSGSETNVIPLPSGGTGTASWNGLAGYLSAAVTPKVTLTGRYETFNDPQGFRTSYSQRWNEGTLTFAYAPQPALLFRLEVRGDHSSTSPWIDSNGNPVSSMSSIGVEGIVKF